MAIATAQDILGTDFTRSSDLTTLVHEIVGPLSPAPDRLRCSGSRAQLCPHLTVGFALVLHELGTNALKHGAWRPDREGQVTLEWQFNTQVLTFNWHERGGLLAPRVRTGFGSRVIEESLPGAIVQRTFHAAGMDCLITVRVPGPNGHPEEGAKNLSERITDNVVSLERAQTGGDSHGPQA